MTEFIRQIWKATTTTTTTPQGPAAPQHTPSPVPMTPIKTESEQPLTNPVIKVEPQTTCAAIPSMTAAPAAVAAMAVVGATNAQVQRAARRDAVNARRDKRKCVGSNGEPGPVDAMTQLMSSTSPAAGNDKVKKMKTCKSASPRSNAADATDGELSSSSCASPTKVTKMASAAKKPSNSMSSMALMNTEIDATGEERLRALEAQLENLDPDSKEAKKKRRLIRNRMSAQLHRERKKAYVGQLEEQLQQKEKELEQLHAKLLAMANESTDLKKKLEVWEKANNEQLSNAASCAEAPEVASSSSVLQVPPITTPVTPEIRGFGAPSLSSHTASPRGTQQHVVTPPPAVDDNVVKKEPFSLVGNDDWDYCLNGWESAVTDVSTNDLLCDFDNPFHPYSMEQDNSPDQQHAQLEIHAAKKNIAMMMAVVFSVTFFGDSAPFYNVANGSNFASMFGANPPREFSQVSIASRVIASLEKTSWKEFRDISSWIGAVAEELEKEKQKQQHQAQEAEEELEQVVPPCSVMSPSAASDITDTSDACASPFVDDPASSMTTFESDLIDDFVYPVDDAFAPVLSDDAWLNEDAHLIPRDDDCMEVDSNLLYGGDVDVALQIPEVDRARRIQSVTSRLYEKLTALWQEKNQVLLTVSDNKKAVMQRSVADMSTIRERMEKGHWLGSSRDDIGQTCATKSEQAKSTPALAEDQSVTFLYPLSAFAPEKRVAVSPSDEIFLEVSCQLNALKL